MSLTTKSKFYYGHTVSESNYNLSFSEGALEIIATLNQGSYSLTDFCVEVERALSAVGGQEYSCTVNRTTRLITISATGNFELLITSGTTTGSSVFSLIGFSGADLTGTNSYVGTVGSGSEYIPQFFLQKFVDFEDMVQANKSNVFESASGIVQTVSFGQTKFMEFNIMFSTDIDQGKNAPIETDLTGVSKLRSFLLYLVTKGDIEFMSDRDTPATFTKCLLESSSGSKDGTGFTLFEMYSKGLANYYETKKLKFRKVV